MIAWVKSIIIEEITSQAEYFRPYETGGCLLGYWAKPLHEVVITDLIGPGPKAKHFKSKFKPDHDWQEAEIAKIYKASGYSHSYLGDWHSHPNSSSANLSWRDHRTLKRISTYAPARISYPLMVIVAKDAPWKIKIWCLELKRFNLITYGKRRIFHLIRSY